MMTRADFPTHTIRRRNLVLLGYGDGHTKEIPG